MVRIRKAVAGGALAAVAALADAYIAGPVGWGEIWTAVGAGIVAGAAVYAIRNAGTVSGSNPKL